MDASRTGLIFERQWLHALALVVLVALCAWATAWPAVALGELWGVGTLVWYWLAIAVAVVHQVYVWLCWRTELHFKGLTRRLGSGAFRAYAVGFSILGILRVVTVFLVAYANQGSLGLDPLVMQILGAVALLPALYLFYSVRRYFGFDRAFGADHFDPAHRDMPFERRGIFRYTSNGMYVFGFLLLWAPALWWNASAGLIVALFNHLYIWVHYYATERPDIRRIYGTSG